jgi:hypothetical protein
MGRQGTIAAAPAVCRSLRRDWHIGLIELSGAEKGARDKDHTVEGPRLNRAM